MTNALHRRPGRPPGATNTRDLVLAAARRAFTEKGYDAASLRQIAGDAGVDQGMVRHFFADKAGLFRAAMELSVDPQAMLPGLLAGGREDLGERLVRWFLEQWDEAGEHSPMVMLVRSAVTHEESTGCCENSSPSRCWAGWPRGWTRRIAPPRTTGTVVAAVAPTLQRYLTGSIE